MCRIISLSSHVVPNSPPFRSGLGIQNDDHLTLAQRNLGRCGPLVVVQDDGVARQVHVPRLVDRGNITTGRWRCRIVDAAAGDVVVAVVAVVDGHSTRGWWLASWWWQTIRWWGCKAVDAAVTPRCLFSTGAGEVTLKIKTNVIVTAQKLSLKSITINMFRMVYDTLIVASIRVRTRHFWFYHSPTRLFGKKIVVTFLKYKLWRIRNHQSQTAVNM